MCRWESWSVVDDTTLRLDLPAANYPNMMSCIQIAEQLMPGVKMIRTYVGGEPDTLYRFALRQWEATP